MLAPFAPPALARPGKGPLILSAISLQDVMNKAADNWAAQGHARPILSFAGSPALARQIRAGAPADLFVSADEQWMDDIERGGLVRAGTRADLAANRLVLIAPVGHAPRLRMGRGIAIARALGRSRLAMADPDSVPAGRYGKAALASLGVWHSVANKVARVDNVRAALALVERGEAALGIVYATDARASRLVSVVGTFPPASHPPIRYPLARLKSSRNADAEGFRRFLLSRQTRPLLARYGFIAP
ncbi:molybdate ABC transporter substrate-binding protein [Sphingobium sp. AN558]|uniref:molybdate ABC transporter substrate-binding protein n=1 Tax=Sphingobium sp. AN558 TaxID=3133442 RepID=UPI0030C226F7